jgi:formylmethanofuran dehydrogenase subunit E
MRPIVIIAVATLTLGAIILQSGETALGGQSADDPARISRDLYERLESFHGHTCGGSLMGARLGLAARAALEHKGIQGKLQAQYFDISCPIDGIQITVGTTYGNRGITAVDRDEHRLLLTDTESGHQVEATLTKQAMKKALASRDLRNKARALPAGSAERRKLEEQVEATYTWLRTAPESEVVSVKVKR